MTTIETTLWIAVIAAAVLLLGVVGWGLARRRRSSGAALGASVRAASTRGAAHETSGEATGTKTPFQATGPGTSASEQEPEGAMLRRLCALAFADVVMPEASAALRTAQADIEAAAIAVLARIDAHPRYTPRRPQLLPQLTRAINDPGASAQSIAAILAQDPALAGNLLRIANSAYYRRHPVPIENLERAVALLGTEGLRQIVLAALLQPVIADDGSALGRLAAILWDHTLLSARAAAGAKTDARDDPHALQLLALLYGLGSVAVVQVLRDTHARHGGARPDPDAIAGLLETWSASCARAISVDWGLSQRVQQALEEPSGDAAGPDRSELGRALHAARAWAGSELLTDKGDGGK